MSDGTTINQRFACTVLWHELRANVKVLEQLGGMGSRQRQRETEGQHCRPRDYADVDDMVVSLLRNMPVSRDPSVNLSSRMDQKLRRTDRVCTVYFGTKQ